MITVPIKDAYAEVLDPLGPSVEEVVRQLAINRANERLIDLQRRLAVWQDKYQCSYELFAYRTATDEEYVAELNRQPPTRV